MPTVRSTDTGFRLARDWTRNQDAGRPKNYVRAKPKIVSKEKSSVRLQTMKRPSQDEVEKWRALLNSKKTFTSKFACPTSQSSLLKFQTSTSNPY